MFSLLDGTASAPIAVGSLPAGLDTSPDGRRMYVANSGGNNLSIVDLTQGAETSKVPVAAGFTDDTPLSVAVADSGLVLFSTTFAGSGFGARMLQLDPVSGAIGLRTDFFVGGSTTEATCLRASGDRSIIGAVAGDISSAPIFRYASATNLFTPEKDLNGFVASIALDRTGAVALVDPGTYVLDSTLNLTGTIPGGLYDVAVDPSGTIGYRVASSHVDVLDLTRLVQTGSIDLGDTTSSASTFGCGGVGAMAISRDGSLLAVITDNGFAIVRTNATIVEPFSAFTARATLRVHGGTGADAFVASGLVTLGVSSDGIQPASEDVTLRIGSVALELPAGSFVPRGQWLRAQATAGGVTAKVALMPVDATAFRVAVRGEGGAFGGTLVPLRLGLLIGDDGGSAALSEGRVAVHSP